MAITLTKPTVGGSEGTWGNTINSALDDVQNALNGTSGTVAPNLTKLTINATDVTATAAELNVLDGVTSTAAELNILDGVTATASELNSLDGITSTAAELNLLDGSVSNTVVNSKAVVYGSSGQVQAVTVDLGDWTITQSGSDLKFAYQGTNRLSLSSSGALTAENDVTAFGSA